MSDKGADALSVLNKRYFLMIMNQQTINTHHSADDHWLSVAVGEKRAEICYFFIIIKTKTIIKPAEDRKVTIMGINRVKIAREITIFEAARENGRITIKMSHKSVTKRCEETFRYITRNSVL